MLDYDWENPPSMTMISGEESEAAVDVNAGHYPRQIIDQYAASQTTFFHPENSLVSSQNPFLSHHNCLQQASQSHIHSLYDHRTDLASSDFAHHSLVSFDPVVGPDAAPSFLLVPKGEDVSVAPPAMEFAPRLGLNLGWRTYFSSEEDDFINRLYRRSGPADSGLANSPKCQAEGCDADLSHSKHYHRRHKVCEYHSKASTVIAAGLTQRFCQQCSRFHLLAEFDDGKRSCRKRLADHNRRRRKTHQSSNQTSQKQPQIPSSSYNLSRSPAKSGAQSSSSVTVATSPMRRMPFHSSTPRAAYPAITSSASSSSIFFSNG